MPSFIQTAPPISVFAHDGGNADIPFSGCVPLAASSTNVQEISIRATSGTAASAKALIFASTTTTNNAAATIAITRPLGGTGLVSLAGFRALHILLTADPLTIAETNGTPASRTTTGEWKITAADGTTILFSGKFSITAADQVYSHSVVLPESGILDASPAAVYQLMVNFTTFALATHLQVLSAAP